VEKYLCISKLFCTFAADLTFGIDKIQTDLSFAIVKTASLLTKTNDSYAKIKPAVQAIIGRDHP
jgi:hypothetical protein